MQSSFRGIEQLKSLEGFRAKAYNDMEPNNPDSIKPGVWTIGYGTTKVDGKPVYKGMTCSQEQATLWLQQDLAPIQTIINQNVKAKISQNMFDALVSFIYNVGQGAFLNSTLLRKLNNKQYVGAADEFKRWNKSQGVILPGLVSRREIERSLFLEGL